MTDVCKQHVRLRECYGNGGCPKATIKLLTNLGPNPRIRLRSPVSTTSILITHGLGSITAADKILSRGTSVRLLCLILTASVCMPLQLQQSVTAVMTYVPCVHGPVEFLPSDIPYMVKGSALPLNSHV
jgi:hypothetical protein